VEDRGFELGVQALSVVDRGFELGRALSVVDRGFEPIQRL
jgi:hypothetical protein